LLCLLNAAWGRVKLDLAIDYNPLNCDCKDYTFISQNGFFSFSHWLDRMNCDAPSELFNRKVSVAHVV